MAAMISAREIVNSEDGTHAQGDPKGLPDEVFLAIGMHVMVTANVETEIDIANGSRGIVEDIVVHSDEANTQEVGLEFRLKRPPACVLVRLERTQAQQLTGLEKGFIPIVPKRESFPLKIPGGQKL
jgi:hypothetical protein